MEASRSVEGATISAIAFHATIAALPAVDAPRRTSAVRRWRARASSKLPSVARRLTALRAGSWSVGPLARPCAAST